MGLPAAAFTNMTFVGIKKWRYQRKPVLTTPLCKWYTGLTNITSERVLIWKEK